MVAIFFAIVYHEPLISQDKKEKSEKIEKFERAIEKKQKDQPKEKTETDPSLSTSNSLITSGIPSPESPSQKLSTHSEGQIPLTVNNWSGSAAPSPGCVTLTSSTALILSCL